MNTKKVILVCIAQFLLFIGLTTVSFGMADIRISGTSNGETLKYAFYSIHNRFLDSITVETNFGDPDTVVAEKIRTAADSADFVATGDSNRVIVNSKLILDPPPSTAYSIIVAAAISKGVPNRGTYESISQDKTAQGKGRWNSKLTHKGTASGNNRLRGPSLLKLSIMAYRDTIDVFTLAPSAGQTPQQIMEDLKDSLDAAPDSFVYEPAQEDSSESLTIMSKKGLGIVFAELETDDTGLLDEDRELSFRQIPSLNQWGIIGLIAVISASGIWMLNRRKKLGFEAKKAG